MTPKEATAQLIASGTQIPLEYVNFTQAEAIGGIVAGACFLMLGFIGLSAAASKKNPTPSHITPLVMGLFLSVVGMMIIVHMGPRAVAPTGAALNDLISIMEWK